MKNTKETIFIYKFDVVASDINDNNDTVIFASRHEFDYEILKGLANLMAANSYSVDEFIYGIKDKLKFRFAEELEPIRVQVGMNGR